MLRLNSVVNLRESKRGGVVDIIQIIRTVLRGMAPKATGSLVTLRLNSVVDHLEARQDGRVDGIPVRRGLVVIVSGVRQWGKTKVLEGCFDIGKTGRIDVYGDKSVSSRAGLLRST